MAPVIEIELDTRWDPALVLRLVWVRALSGMSIGVACIFLTMLGPNRILVACLLLGPVPLGSFVVRKCFEVDRFVAVATTIDMVWAVVIACLVPSAFALTMMAAIAMLAFVANEDTKTLFVMAGIGGLGFTTAGLVRDIAAWIPMVVVYVLLLPLLFFFAATQRERDLRHQLRFRHRVEHDSLTGLRNRAGLASA